MKFTAQEEYGIRCLLQVARADEGVPISIEEVAESEAITPAHAAKLLRLLRQDGIIESIRGQKGGYRLARPSSDIRLSEVFAALGDRPYSKDFCRRYSGQADRCVHQTECAVRSLWVGLDKVIFSFLEECRVSDLLGGESPMAEWVSEHIRNLPQVLNIS